MNDRVRAVALGNDPADLLLKNGRVVGRADRNYL